MERLNILKMSILLKLIYIYKAISKGFFSPPVTLQIEPKIYWESSLLKNSRSYMQKKWYNLKIIILQQLLKWIPIPTDAKTIRWKVDSELKYRNQADKT